MDIMKSYEISCSYCGCADHYIECSKKEAIQQHKGNGYIVKNNESFCDEGCQSSFIKNGKQSRSNVESKLWNKEEI